MLEGEGQHTINTTHTTKPMRNHNTPKYKKTKTDRRGLRAELCPEIDARGGANKSFLFCFFWDSQENEDFAENHGKVGEVVVGGGVFHLGFGLGLIFFCV